jgi:hypothetical protein
MLKRLFIVVSLIWMVIVFGSTASRGGITEGVVIFALAPPAILFALWWLGVFVLTGRF